MSRHETRRYVVAVAAVAAGALLQACAVTTGSFIPSRSVNSNRALTSYYNGSHMQLTPATPHSTMTTTHEKGFQDYKYY